MPQVIVYLDEKEDNILKKYIKKYYEEHTKKLSKNDAIKQILKGE